MPKSGSTRRLIVGLSLLASVLIPPASGSAQVGTGELSGSVYDEVSWYPISGVCATATAHTDSAVFTGESASSQFWIDGLPYGTYDVTIDDCGAGIYSSSTFADVEISPPSSESDWEAAHSDLTIFLEMKGQALITGQVVEDYGGYPLYRKRVVLVDPATEERIRETCTGRDGRYQIAAPIDTPVYIKFDDGCSGVYLDHLTEWYPSVSSIDDAVTASVAKGSHFIAHAAMTLRGGFVGVVYDPSGEVPGYGWKVVAKEGPFLSSAEVRQDGSFGITRVGNDILIRLEPDAGWDGYETLYLADPNNPGVPEAWNVDSYDRFDLGWIALDRPPALSGRIVDTNGYAIEGAVVSFVPEDDHGTVPTITATTDQLGWYVTTGTATGRYTAVVTVPTSDHAPWLEYNGTWLGDTPERSQATIVTLDGSNQGGFDFMVSRGKASGLDVAPWTWDGARELTTDREHDGATPLEPLEISTYIETQAASSVGTTLETNPLAGFTHFPLGAIVILDADPAAGPQSIGFALEPSLLPGEIDDMQVIWNEGRLGSCSAVGPPCVRSIHIGGRDDVIVTVEALDGGKASFVWGPPFLDLGSSIFADDIVWLADAGVTRGCSPPINDLFCPTDEVTRGQMAAFLVRYLGLTDTGTTDFVDDDGSVFETDIERLAAAGITRGCNPPTNNMFCPNDAVTREQMAAFLSRALKLANADGVDFRDDDGSVFETDIERLAAAGITRGCNPPTNDMFCPKDTVTREQMAAFLHRAAGASSPLPTTWIPSTTPDLSPIFRRPETTQH